MLTRRQLLACAATPVLGAKLNPKVNGVKLGVQSYSFRDRSLDEAIKAMQALGIGCCEAWNGHIEPLKAPREELRKWRETVSMEPFREARKKFDDAGIELLGYTYPLREDFSDKEIERGFEMARALGVKFLTASSNVSNAKRIDVFAAKAKIPVGMHNHSRIAPNDFARPEDFEQAMAGMSKYINVNLDIGHFVASGFDPVAFTRKHHGRIVSIHLKDRRKDQGANVPFGEGDTPIKDVLQLLRKEKWAIPAVIEYEYKGADSVAEVKKCFDYCKAALA